MTQSNRKPELIFNSPRALRITLIFAIVSVIFWLWLMGYVYSDRKSFRQIMTFAPYLLLAGVTGWRAFRRLNGTKQRDS